MSSVTINQNVAECLRSVNHVGGTTIRNICSGTEAYVPWGALDWIGWGLVGVLMFGAAAMFAAMSYAFFRDC